MIHEYEVYRIITDILIENNIVCKVEYVPTGYYKCMSYVPDDNKIKFNHYNINGINHKNFSSINIYDFTRIIAYHELGHIIDIELNGYENRDKLEMEVEAWEQAEKLIENDLLQDFYMIMAKHLNVIKEEL